MLILCLELIRGRLAVMSVEIRKLFFIILTSLIEKSPVSGRQSFLYCWSVLRRTMKIRDVYLFIFVPRTPNFCAP